MGGNLMDRWNILVEKTRQIPLLRDSVVIKESGAGVTFSLGLFYRIMGILVLGFVGLFFSFFYFSHAMGSTYVWCMIVGFCGLVGLIGLHLLIQVNKVYLRPGEADLVIRYGSFFWSRVLKVRRDRVLARLYLDEKKRKFRVGIQEGMLVLALQKVDGDTEVILSANRYASSLPKAFEILSRFLRAESVDTTLTGATADEWQGLKISKSPISETSSSFSSMSLAVSGDRAEFQATWSMKILAPVFLIFGLSIFFLLFSDIIGEEKVLNRVLGIVLAVGVGGIFTVIGFLGTFFGFGTRRIIADRGRRQITIYRGIGSISRGKYIRHFDQIAAVQICNQAVTDVEGRPPYVVWEINLVLNQPLVERIGLVAHANDVQIRSEARRFAEFIDKPLLDHSQNIDFSN
jgi:hypothetical protein